MSTQLIDAPSLMAGGGRLLAALAGDSRITFQTFDESTAQRRGMARIFHGTLAQHAEALADLNRQGGSVNFMVNDGDGRGRRAANVLAIRALFVDLDGAPLQPVLDGPLQPHAVVQSSPGRFHAYWLVNGVGLSEFKQLQRALAAMFDGDRTVTDLARVMRLPGSMHNKHDPVPCELVSLVDFPRYARKDVVAAFPVKTRVVSAPSKLRVVDGSIPEGERNETLFNLARGLVNKGYGPVQVLDRVQAVNAKKCAMPLCATEVDALVASAVAYGPSGFLNLPLRVFDSPAYRGLSHPARTIAAAAYRRYNSENNGEIALQFEDFRVEFTRRETFYDARREVLAAGLIIRARSRCYIEGLGWRPDLYEVALSPPGGPNQDRSAVN